MLKQKKHGFTLIELLVVIAIIAMLAAILIPAVSGALLNAAMTTTASNGRGIYLAVFGKSLDGSLFSATAAWPTKTEAPTSTQYFKDLVSNGVMNVTFDFFGARGTAALTNKASASSFGAGHNAWNLVCELKDSHSDGTPFLFTKNAGTTIPTTTGKLTLEADAVPFGDKGMVVVHKGGSSYKLRDRDVTGANFNPSQSSDGLDVAEP